MGKPNFSAELPAATLQQIEELKPLFNGNKTQLIIQAVKLLHQQEIDVETKFAYKGFDVQITEQIGGYGFEATSADGDGWSVPNPKLNTPAYQTIGIAAAEAKRRITRYLNDMAFDGDE